MWGVRDIYKYIYIYNTRRIACIEFYAHQMFTFHLNSSFILDLTIDFVFVMKAQKQIYKTSIASMVA